MSVQSNLSYAAQITISLPGSGEQVTMTVMLWPADVVEVGIPGELWDQVKFTMEVVRSTR